MGSNSYIELVKQSIAQGQFCNSYHHFPTLAILTLLLLYLNIPYFLFMCSLLSCKPIQQHLQCTSSFILVLGKANVKRAQSCIGGRQNLREYLFYLQLLIGFDTLTYRKRLQFIPYTCGLSKLHADGLLESLDYESFDACEPCLMGMMTKTPFSGTMEQATDLLEIIHTDVCCPMSVEARGGYRYFLTFTDGLSRLSIST